MCRVGCDNPSTRIVGKTTSRGHNTHNARSTNASQTTAHANERHVTQRRRVTYARKRQREAQISCAEASASGRSIENCRLTSGR